MLGSSCRASRVDEKAQVLLSCKASVHFGAQVLRGQRPTWQARGAILGLARRMAVERTSVFVERFSLCGVLREPEV